jgi:hypothetical protein
MRQTIVGCRERGFALPLMLGVLMVGSILVATAFLLARLEFQSGENGLHAVKAFEAAESGLSEIVAWWDPVLFDTLPVGGNVVLPVRTLGQGGYQGTVTRLSAPLFLLESEGWHQPPGALPRARRTVASLVRLEQSKPIVVAALTVVDTLVWDAQSSVSGNDTIPPGWAGTCPSLDSAVAGIGTGVGTQVSLGSCVSLSCLSGAPPHAVDSSIADSTLLNGPLDFFTLSQRALHQVGGLVGPVGPALSGTPASCAVADSLNWGEPLHAGPFATCGQYFPVIHAPGDLTLSGGRGQGVLLVDGSLVISGGADYTGIVIVLGTLRNGAGGGSVTGAVLAKNVELNPALPSSGLRIQYSACVLPPSISGSSLATPLPSRSWAQNF